MHNITKLEDIQLNLVCGGIGSIVPDIAMLVVISIMGLFVCSVHTADALRNEEYDEEEARMRRVRMNNSTIGHNLQPNNANAN